MLYSLEPVLDIVHGSRGDGVDVKRCLGEVLEDKDEIEMFQTVLHTLQRGDLKVGGVTTRNGGR